MADVNANIGINIDSSNALAQLKALQRQISQFHTSIARSSEAAALAQKGLQKNLLNSINSIGAFSAEMRTVRTSAESFTNSLEKNKFSMREYFRYAGASTKTFGRLFKSEFDTIGKVAEERTKRLQTQYIKMGRDTNGAMKAMSIMPTQLNMSDYTTKIQIAAQKQALFNQLMKQGSTNLLNFGKNTQWAGRQLMVGFTLPLMLVGSTATKTFMDMEAQALRFRKVYGDLFTPQQETQEALDNITELGRQFTKYGVAVSTTVGLASEAAAAGFSGLDLQRQTAQATRLSILGQVESQKALETTISLQNAFGMSSDKLAESIDFLNAVENQTVVSLDDITTAIPKVAPVIQQLGGDVKDLAFFMAAMKEGGINASEGANALKSGLAALINPTKKASEMLASYGINATAIVEKNKGDLKATVIGFAQALNQLDPLARARAIEQMFGKFQFARLSTLFANVAKDGNQAARVLDLANSSVEELSALSEKELGMTADSAMNKFKKSVEDLKFALIPVGKAFLEAATPIVEFVGNILEKFANLSDGTKKLITLLTVGIGAVGPVLLMTFGLLANGVANIIKLFLTLRGGYQRLTGQSQILGEQTQYMTMEQLDAAAAAHSLNQTHANLTQTFTAEVAQINKLIAAYTSAAGAARNFSMNNPGMMMPGRGARKLASGIVSVPGPKGAGDVVPAMLSPGEAVIPAKFVEKYGPLIQGMVSGSIPGYQEGRSLGTAVDVPGGMDVSHFGSKSSRTGAELLAIIEGLETSAARNIRKMVASFDNGLSRVFTTFDNQVVAQFTEINRLMQTQGKASTQKVKQNLVGASFAETRDIELQRQLVSSGMAIDEFKIINKKITDEVVKGFDALGDKTEITSEELNNLLRKAYEEVSKTDARVEKAYNNMKQVSTVFSPDRAGVRGSRIPITEDSYVKQKKSTQRTSSQYRKMQGQMVGAENIPYAQSSRFVVTNNIAKELGLSSKQAAAIYQKMSTDAKVTLSRMRNDLTAFKKEFIIEAAKVGEMVGTSAVNATAKAAGTASPSRKTRRTGEDIARGLEEGMKSRQDDVALVGSQLGQAATGGVRGGSRQIPFTAPGQPGSVARNIPTTPGMNINDIAAKARMNREILLSTQQQKRITAMNQRMDRLNKGFMSGTFALSALSGVASMAGGNLGKFSEIIFQITGPLFALSSIIQLLTGQKIIGYIMQFRKILGPVALGLTALTIAGKLYLSAKEKERLAIEGVGKAANLTSKQIDKLGEVLGFTPLKSNLELAKPTVSGLTPEQSKQVEQTRKLLATDKDFKEQVKAVGGATNEQADIIFKSLALRLSGQGATKEAINTYIYALQQQAGKTNVKFDLKSIDLSTKEGRAGLQNSVNTLLKDYKTEFDKGYKKTKVFVGGGKGGGVVKDVEVLSKDLKKSLSTVSNVIQNTFMGLDTQLRSGIINADQFSQSFDGISASIQSMPKANALYLMSELMKSLPSELAQSAAGIKNVSDQMMILKAATLGVSISAAMISALGVQSGDGGSERTKGRIRARIIKETKERMKIAEEVVKSLGGTVTGTGEKGPTNKEKYDKAYGIIKNFFDSQEALIRRQRKSEADLLQNKIDNAQKAVDAAQKEIDAKQELIDANNREADLLNRKIELNYDRPIQKLQDESTILSNNLEIIRNQEDGINKQYDAQINALEKISSLNQEVAAQEKSRLTIADALTSGDISAAAVAVQEARAQAAASRIEQQKTSMEASRTTALAGINAGGMTKDQIEARTYQIGQQTFLLEQQKKVLQDQITVIQDKNYAIEQQIYTVKQNSLIPSQKIVDDTSTILKNYNETTDKIVASVTYLGQTNDQWEANRIKVEAANAQLEFTNTNLKTAKSAAAAILADWNQIKSKVITITTNYVTSGSSSGRVGRMYGGSIPKYMAFGGRAMGSDTIPAMLTPGEFVINKAASKAYRPLLEKINESKYPGMLGGGGMTQIPVNNISTSMNDNSTAVYNYNLGFSINGSNGSAKDIANAVMREIKNVDSQRIRGQRR
jgi:TP901 family phage tail tape measure protein